jgi:hypothetical protein
MAKKRKSYYRKKQKGTRYVAKALAKYFGKRYPTYSDRLNRAREISNQIKGSGNKVILQNIFGIERIPRIKKKINFRSEDIMAGIDPFLTDQQKEIFKPNPFYELGSYPDLISGMDSDLNITFVSEVSPIDSPSFKSGENIGYQAYFANFVNYTNRVINKIQNEIGRKLTSDEIEYYVMATPPDENGISRIVSVDSDGNSNDWGFDPKNPEKEPFETILPPAEKKPDQTRQPIEEQISSQLQEPQQPVFTAQEQIRLEELKTQQEIAGAQKAKAEAELAKATTLNNALQMLQSGTISHDQFDKILGSL